MPNPLRFPLSAETQREREALQQTLREALVSANLPTVQTAQEKLCVWLQTHPDDFALWEEGKPLAMLADTLQSKRLSSLSAV